MKDYIDWNDPIIDKQLQYYRNEAIRRNVYNTANELVRYVAKAIHLTDDKVEYTINNISEQAKLVKLRYYVDVNRKEVTCYLVDKKLHVTPLNNENPEAHAKQLLENVELSY